MLRSIPSKVGGVVTLALAIVILFALPFFTYFREDTETNHALVTEKSVEEGFTTATTTVEAPAVELDSELFDDIKDALSAYARFYSFTLQQNIRKFLLCGMVAVCFLLAFIGGQPIEYPYLLAGRWLTILYFLYFKLLASSHTAD